MKPCRSETILVVGDDMMSTYRLYCKGLFGQNSRSSNTVALITRDEKVIAFSRTYERKKKKKKSKCRPSLRHVSHHIILRALSNSDILFPQCVAETPVMLAGAYFWSFRDEIPAA